MANKIKKFDPREAIEQLKRTDKKELAKHIGIVILGIIVLFYIFEGVAGFMNRNRMFASGTIEATEIEVATKVPGRVESYSVNEGSIVIKGDIIATLESAELQASLNQAKALEDSARIRYENAMRNNNRAKSLKKKNMISDQEYDAIQSAYEASESEYNRSKAARVLSEISYNESNIKAPISGTILTKVAENGDLLAPYSTVVTMADLVVLDMIIYVPERSYGRIKLGNKAAIYVDSYPGQKFTGWVVRISNKAEFTPKNIQTKDERVTQVFAVKVEIPNTDGKLKPGMPADAVIFLSKK